MSDVAIKVEGLGKKYLIRHQGGGRHRYVALRDVLAGKFKGLLNWKPETGNRKSVEEFWALKDVSFQIKHGEAVGIIGRNGAGKSTLLKLLSRITEPSGGRIELEGRVASLLEVGTGFHPELTGRENIFLNGAILGMHRAEIRKKFDEIVAFADVERFLDTPVKHFSSGMYMRLAFAVASHLEQEILIVDEVLAVGDALFQKKCLSKMDDVRHSGRTILFVSHNMDAILRLCSRAIFLQAGRILEDGAAQSVVARYTTQQLQQPASVSFEHLPAGSLARRNIRISSVAWPPSAGNNPPWVVPFGEPIHFFVNVHCLKPVQNVELGIALHAPTGTEIASSSSIATRPGLNLAPGKYTISVTYRSLNLVPGGYNFGIGLKSAEGSEEHFPNAFSLDVVPSEKSSLHKTDTFWGYVVPDVAYEFNKA
jgi:lipopolysaccharide transport system ATP-binding protein